MLAEARPRRSAGWLPPVGSDTTPMLYMLGEKYIASLERMGSTDNAKVGGVAGRSAGGGARASWASS